jgi:hypothetical protein
MLFTNQNCINKNNSILGIKRRRFFELLARYKKDILENDYNQKVSLSTIINRAKTNGFYLTKPKRKVHDKEVIINYPGELIQHDSSHHPSSVL